MHVNLGNTVRREKSAVNPVEEDKEPSTTLVDGLVADNSSEIVRKTVLCTLNLQLCLFVERREIIVSIPRVPASWCCSRGAAPARVKIPDSVRTKHTRYRVSHTYCRTRYRVSKKSLKYNMSKNDLLSGIG